MAQPVEVWTASALDKGNNTLEGGSSEPSCDCWLLNPNLDGRWVQSQGASHGVGEGAILLERNARNGRVLQRVVTRNAMGGVAAQSRGTGSSSELVWRGLAERFRERLLSVPGAAGGSSRGQGKSGWVAGSAHRSGGLGGRSPLPMHHWSYHWSYPLPNRLQPLTHRFQPL